VERRRTRLKLLLKHPPKPLPTLKLKPKPQTRQLKPKRSPRKLPPRPPKKSRLRHQVAIESRQRSESFYRAGGPTSPTGLTPAGGVSSEIYREQVQRIEELEKENSRLTGEVDEYKGKWSKGEEELEEFREGRGDVALAIEKGKQADKLVWD
jgi:hypothetical protein